MQFEIRDEKNIPISHLKNLYEDVEWYAYTNDLNLLQQACCQSLAVFSVWQEDTLLGLIRIVGDGLTIIYIQDILVLTTHQNQGIATLLMQHVLNKYKDVRQKVLLTEEAPDVRHFYEKNGFISCDKGSLVSFAKLS
ncbi:MAG: GNAT family N-acetyltransferase [Solibacillus sp.]|uniref:GNAT family N-acetyltransferase n=1 Tax=Solibacillus sp. TaxID=1909654 RepID=UPI0033150834